LALRKSSSIPYEPLAPSLVTFANIATATALTLFALTGFENATAPVDKVRDPARTIPRAILGGTAFVGLIYLVSSSGGCYAAGTTDCSVVCPMPIITRATERAVALAGSRSISAFGGPIHDPGTPAAGHAMACGDLPVGMTRTGHDNTRRAHSLAGRDDPLILATRPRRRPLHLRHPAGRPSSFLYAAGQARPEEIRRRRLVFLVALLFILFAFYGAGLEADLWFLVLLAIGISVRVLVRRLRR
jgi:APA family basic amino acid/polyamine antiporter